MEIPLSMDQKLDLILQQNEAIQLQNQELQQQNRELRSLLNGAMNTVPITVRDELQNFLTQFTQALENREPSKTAEAIKELSAILKELKERLTSSELIHADMTAQVSFATDEIRTFKEKLLNQFNGGKPANN